MRCLAERLHAATRIVATDRRRLERLCRYVIRPPIASGRLRFADAETLVFSLKTHWADGTCQLLLSPQELLEKLAALVPPPRLNLVRYHGVLAPACPDRAKIVPGPSALTQTAGCEHGAPSGRRVHRVSRAKLLARVFQYDVRVCPSCLGRMKVIAALTQPAATESMEKGCSSTAGKCRHDNIACTRHTRLTIIPLILLVRSLPHEHNIPIVSRDTHFDMVRGLRRISW